MSLVMQAKPKSAELILVFLILRVNISGKRTSQMVINVLAFGGIKMFFLKNHVEKSKDRKYKIERSVCACRRRSNSVRRSG